MAWSYEEWVQEQTEKIASGLNRYAMGGIYDAGVWVLPSNGSTQGELILALPHQPPGMLEVLRFPNHGSRISAIPRSQLYSAIWQACRNQPICPIS